MLGGGSNRLNIDRRLLGAGRNRFGKPAAALGDQFFLGAAAHFLGAAADARNHAPDP